VQFPEHSPGHSCMSRASIAAAVSSIQAPPVGPAPRSLEEGLGQHDDVLTAVHAAVEFELSKHVQTDSTSRVRNWPSRDGLVQVPVGSRRSPGRSPGSTGRPPSRRNSRSWPGTRSNFTCAAGRHLADFVKETARRPPPIRSVPGFARCAPVNARRARTRNSSDSSSESGSAAQIDRERTGRGGEARHDG